MCCFEQILSVASDQTAALQPLISHLINHPSKTSKTYLVLLEKEELKAMFFPGARIDGHTSIGRPAKTYIHMAQIHLGKV